MSLTGRRRFRTTMPWSMTEPQRVLVLQVEYSMWSDLYNTHICYWRDATPEDVSEVVVDLPNTAG